jgi:small subunit ribosomal protein S1
MQEEVERQFSVDDPVLGTEVAAAPLAEKAEMAEGSAFADEEIPAEEMAFADIAEEEDEYSADDEDSDAPHVSEPIPPAHRPGLAMSAGAEPTTMEALMEQEHDYRDPERGETLDGTVISITPDGLIVDVGLKREGIVPQNDLDRLDKAVRNEIKVGDEMFVYVLRPRDRDGNLLLSIYRARSEVDWKKAQDMMDSGEILEGKVTANNQGGLVVPFGKIRGFLPASQIVGIPRRLTEEAKIERLQQMVDQTLPLKVIEVDRRRRRLIFSHRAAWWKWKEVQRNRLMEDLKEGDRRKGVVSSLRDFGAFIDLGGADGLIHVSELAWHRVKHPSEVLKVGDEIEAYVLGVDKDRKRIALSLKRLQPEPWSVVEQEYQVGQLVQGVVTRVVDFGAFVKIDEGVEGLIHKSELADVMPVRTNDLVKDGDLLLLRIIRIDGRRRRIGLSLRQVTEQEWSDWAATFRAGKAAAAAEAPAVEATPVSEATIEPAEQPAEEATPAAEATIEPAEQPAEEAAPAGEEAAPEPIGES